jgi:hypothetical protein
MGQIDDDIDGMVFADFDDGLDDDVPPPRDVRCRHCQSEDVYWAKDATGRWALYNFNSRKHVCNDGIVTSIRLDAFDDLAEEP